MKKLQFFILLLAFLATANATGERITSLSRDFATVNSYAPGGWHYDMLWNNGTRTPMTYDTANTRWWTESNGDGFITNNTSVFKAEPGKSTVFYPPTIAGGHAVFGNLSANWTSNFSGTMSLSGWFQNGSLNSLGYNISIWHNSALLFSQKVAGPDGTNYTFSVTDSVAIGDNITIVGSAGTTGQSPHINATMDVFNTTVVSTPGFDSNCTGTTACYKFYQNFSSTQGTNNINYVYSTTAGASWSQMTWNGSSWLMTANYQAGGIQNQTNGLFTAHTSDDAGNGKYVGFEINNNYDFKGGMNFSGTIKKNSCAGGDGIIVKVKSASNTQTVYTIPGVCANTSFNSFSVNLTSIVSGPLYVFVDGVTTDSSDLFQFANWTLSGNGTYNGFMRVRAYDELNPLNQKQFNLTIANSTNTTNYFVNYSNAPEFNKSVSEIPSGTITLTFRNASCLTSNVIPRQISLDTATSNLNISEYLLCDGSTPQFVSFDVLDSYTNARIDGAAIALQKSFTGTYVNVSTMTSTSGTVSFWMDLSTTYQIAAYKTGYLYGAAAYQPSSSTSNRILLVSGTAQTFNYSNANISYTWGPQYAVNSTTVFWFQINSSDSTLVQYGMDLLLNDAWINQTNATTPAGSNVSLTRNLTALNANNVTAIFWWIKSGFSRYNATYIYYIQNSTNQNSSLTGAIDNFKQNPPSKTFTGIIAILVTAPIAAWVVRFSNPSVGGIVALIILGFFTFLTEWISWPAFFLLALFLGTVIYFIRGRG